jgi:hypothetical protein
MHGGGFGGFHPPVEGGGALNDVNAGATVPVKFTLSGAGTDLPIDSQPVECNSRVPTGEAPSPLDSPGAKELRQKGNEYHVNWKTDASWEGTCRRLTLRIPAVRAAASRARTARKALTRPRGKGYTVPEPCPST